MPRIKNLLIQKTSAGGVGGPGVVVNKPDKAGLVQFNRARATAANVTLCGASRSSRLRLSATRSSGMDIWNEPVTYKKGAAYLGACSTIKPLFEDYIGLPRAVDPANGDTQREHRNKSPLWGGVLTTAGGLGFTGTSEGKLIAFDNATGEVLWSCQTGPGIVGSPVTWEQDGEQFVCVASCWGGAVALLGGEVAKTAKSLSQGGMLWTLRLPQQIPGN